MVLMFFLFWPRHDNTNIMSVRIRPVWSESSLCAQWVAKGPRFLHADSDDSDQTGRMPRLIWVFAGRTIILLVLSSRGSFLCGFVAFTPLRFVSSRSLFFVLFRILITSLGEERTGLSGRIWNVYITCVMSREFFSSSSVMDLAAACDCSNHCTFHLTFWMQYFKVLLKLYMILVMNFSSHKTNRSDLLQAI